MLQRVVEPELMEDADQAAAYAGAGFEEPNRLFCEQLERLALPPAARVLDLGCGPADIPLRLARQYPGFRLTAVDGSAAMLVHARRAVDRAGLAARVELVQARLGALPLPEHAFDAVLSNSLLHHLHDPHVLWREVGQRARPQGAVLVMDLYRPTDEPALRALVERYVADEPAVLQRDFAASLRAAFTPEEVRAQLRDAGLERLDVERVSDRHMLIHGRL